MRSTVNTTGETVVLELGQVSSTDAVNPYHAIPEVVFSETVMALSPDGERLYVGRAGNVLEIALSQDVALPAPWLAARTLRAIPIDGRADLLKMDSQGTRLLYLDYELQLTGLVE